MISFARNVGYLLVCTECETSVDIRYDDFCPGCKTPAELSCSNCETPINVNDEFCPGCESFLVHNSQPPKPKYALDSQKKPHEIDAMTRIKGLIVFILAVFGALTLQDLISTDEVKNKISNYLQSFFQIYFDMFAIFCVALRS